MNEDIDTFIEHLLFATSQIRNEFINFPIIGSDIARERVYCYELYHQLRLSLPKGFNYSLNGEVDKSGHPIIYDQCGGISPDFLIHRPGSMNDGDNLIILEVKPIQRAIINGGLGKDFEVLNCMTSIDNGYQLGIILIYGEGHYKRKQEICTHFETEFQNQNIRLFFHDSIKKAALEYNELEFSED